MSAQVLSIHTYIFTMGALMAHPSVHSSPLRDRPLISDLRFSLQLAVVVQQATSQLYLSMISLFVFPCCGSAAGPAS